MLYAIAMGQITRIHARSVERGICPINKSTMNYIAHALNGRISTSGLKSDVIIVFLDPDFFETRKFRRFAYI